ncbi:MAG TPA: hypothetical protein VLT59_08340 [Steroidobacteraceae bacterium]|nr:hypothetical protein [Steroidobacteraceae bacterium]
MTSEPREIAISAQLQEGVVNAFEVAALWLQESEELLFVLASENGEPQIATIDGCQTQTEVLERLRDWTSAKPGIEWLVQVGCATTGGNGAGVDALVAHCAERGQPEGFVLLQELHRNATDNVLVPTGEIEFVQRIKNDFCT